MNRENLTNSIDKAAKSIRTTWPLYSFVTSNPLAGYETMSFLEAVIKGKGLSGGDLLPGPAILQKALNEGEIDKKILSRLLTASGIGHSAEDTLELMAEDEKYSYNENAVLDRIISKWLTAFMDEGIAEWEMPFKAEGFYKAWRKLAVYDRETGLPKNIKMPKNALEAIAHALADYPEDEHQEIMEYHFAALPGWAGYIKFRIENNSPWQNHYPVSLEDYLAVRLWTAIGTGATIKPAKKDMATIKAKYKIRYIWLQAWENSWQDRLISKLAPKNNAPNTVKALADAQMVFCIDTRSEVIRRHIESTGNYETYGYAGFFGIAMDYMNPTTGITSKSCPPILNSSYTAKEVPVKNGINEFLKYQNNKKRNLFKKYFLKRMKNLLPSAFGFVEASGLAYGALLLLKSLFRGANTKTNNNANLLEKCCTPSLMPTASQADNNISLEEKTIIVKTALDLMGWKEFSPLVLFVGHGSHSSNNPFASSLDCGACAASPGRHNARMLAELANLPEVRKNLKEIYSITVPDNTLFIAGEHNTTTDEITLFDASLPTEHSKQLLKLKDDLKTAQRTAIAERLGKGERSNNRALRKARDWSETRPEWGLAKNAGFIIGPRMLTKHINLESQCFLHSYNWESDPDATALEAIMQGPMVVTQWINNHYYFATVDNEKFGGGSKISHNITGTFGVVQGNGGDLKSGLPLQSVNSSDSEIYHKPLRLSVIIQAPLKSVKKVLEKNENLKTLINNEWISLLVMDPTKENRIVKYKESNKVTNSEAVNHNYTFQSA
jgi:uncharacterized protein YbcC (UPF0753/DUF2309 family)